MPTNNFSTTPSDPSFVPALLNTPEAARYLCLSERTLESYRHKGGGPPFIKIGGGSKQARVRYSKSAMDEWIASKTQSTDEPETAESDQHIRADETDVRIIALEAEATELADERDGALEAMRVFSVNYDAAQARVAVLEAEEVALKARLSKLLRTRKENPYQTGDPK